MAKLYLNILDDKRKLVFQKLSIFRSMGYLSGGTALALQLGHRVSCDFDIFCAKEISSIFAAKVRKEIEVKETVINNADEFTFFTKHDIKISFVFYPFNLKKYLIDFPDFSLQLISPLGAAITKAYAISRRNAWRDYVDLYVIFKKGIVTIDDVVREAKTVYGNLFNEKFFLAQLVYTDDISHAEIKGTHLIESASPDEVKVFFENQVDEYLKGKLQYHF